VTAISWCEHVLTQNTNTSPMTSELPVCAFRGSASALVQFRAC
jgi:hypothetical protein